MFQHLISVWRSLRTFKKIVRPSQKPTVEALENRSLLSGVNLFLGSVSGAWSIPGNWSQGHIPQSDEQVICGYDADGQPLQTSSLDDIQNLTVYSVTVEQGSTITFNPTVNLSCVQFDNNIGNLIFNGGSVFASAHFYNYQATILVGGANNSGQEIITTDVFLTAPEAIVDIVGPGLVLNGYNYQFGTINVGGPVSLLTGGVAGTWVINGESDIDVGATMNINEAMVNFNTSNGVGWFVVKGTLNFNGAGGILDGAGNVSQGGSTQTGSEGVWIDGTVNFNAILTTTSRLITGNVFNDGHINYVLITPGSFQTASLGGSYVQTINGFLSMNVAGDGLTISGSASLAGHLVLNINPNLPAGLYGIISAQTISGDFDDSPVAGFVVTFNGRDFYVFVLD